MKRISSISGRQQGGALNILLIPFILVSIFFLVAAGYGVTSYNESQHYKNDTDEITNTALEAANVTLNQQKDKEFAEKAKFPFDTYTSSADTGNVIIKYPKTWSAYVEEASQGSIPVNGYFYPNFVPSTSDNKTNYAVRLRIIQQTYGSLLQQYSPQVQSGAVRLQPYKPPNIPGVIGSRMDGTVQTQKQGTMVLFPIRDKTVLLWTEATGFNADYFNIILPNFSMTP